MAENITITSSDKALKYNELMPQLEALINDESDSVANMANFAAALKQTFNFFWVGFYIVRNEELVLGPFQGPVACTRIAKGKGVCGTAWQTEKTQLVPDVHAFPGHIACSAASQSEIVVPVFNKQHEVIAVLDIDSDVLQDFDEIDKKNLEKAVKLLS